jgi:chaperonin GroES
LADQVIIKRDDAEKVTQGGIHLPDKAQNIPRKGTVLAAGPGRILDNGTRGEMELKAGDRVYFSAYGVQEVEIDDEKVIICREADMLAVIESE